MQSTLKHQIFAVNQARAEAQNETMEKRLNDAASTIAAINLIGLEKIRALPQLLQACKKVCDDIGYNNEVGEILKRLSMKTYVIGWETNKGNKYKKTFTNKKLFEAAYKIVLSRCPRYYCHAYYGNI